MNLISSYQNRVMYVECILTPLTPCGAKYSQVLPFNDMA